MGTHDSTDSFNPPLPCGWWKSLDISERTPHCICPNSIDLPNALGAKRFLQWRSQPPFDNEEFFTRRLATSNCSPEVLAYLLAEPSEALKERVPPPTWLQEIGAALDPRPLSPLKRRVLPEVDFTKVPSAFLIPFEPLIAEARTKLEIWADKQFNDNESAPLRPRMLSTFFTPPCASGYYNSL